MNILSGGCAQRVLIARAPRKGPRELLIMGCSRWLDRRRSRARLASIVAMQRARRSSSSYTSWANSALSDRELHQRRARPCDGTPHIDDDHEQHHGGGDHCHSR